MATRIGDTLRSTSIALLFGSLFASTIALSPASAKDPFTGRTAKPIGDKTEAVFNAMFKEGNYIKAKDLIDDAKKTEASEPLLHALSASLIFANSATDDDTRKGNSGSFLTAAQDTKRAAQELVKTDAARGNLYLAVGNFLESAHIVATRGIVQGTPDALGKLTSAFQNLGEAEKLDANDPEFNLIKGTMDLLLAVNINLPLSDADAAIARVQKASPNYISDRVLAWGYRDMKKLDNALASVNRTISAIPQNPEVYYLRGQILVQESKKAEEQGKKAESQSKKAESVKDFRKALEQYTKLTPALRGQFCHDLSQVDPDYSKVDACKG